MPGPLHYLVLIGAVDVLQPLYTRVLVPQTVAGELQDANTPATILAWIAYPPAWCEIHPDPPPDPALGFLDAGEQSAITLALSVNADRLLIDEQAGPRRGRAPASARHWYLGHPGRGSSTASARFRGVPRPASSNQLLPFGGTRRLRAPSAVHRSSGTVIVVRDLAALQGLPAGTGVHGCALSISRSFSRAGSFCADRLSS
jgi:hypothetical protein